MVEEVTSSVVGEVVDSLLDVAKREIGYIWNSTENVEKLKKEAENLKLMREKVQQQINSSKRKGDDLLHGVQDWVEKAGVEISKADEFLELEAKAKRTKFGLFGNRYYYGKWAANMTLPLQEHQQHGTTYQSCVSVDTPAPGRLDVYQNKNLDDIATHISALGDIIKALENENIQIIGIYGLGGVGKTTLAIEVVAKVNNLFADVAFTTVSQTVNAEQIQNDIENAAKRIMKGEKVLIILDDVWEKLNLEEMCIPCGIDHKNCKILFTSRSLNVCEKMNAQCKICVNSLPTAEAWILFKRVVGERLETQADLKRVAMKVVEECGGLPLLIQAVGNALKNKSINSWNAALLQLKKHAPLDIDPDIRNAFTNLKLSYDYLESEETKSCFLLCGMFPEDERIVLEDLVRYGVGLGKFDDLDSIEDARDRVRNAVNILTSSGLLLNVDNICWTKMHDVVRDVALLIASEGENKYLVKAGIGLTEWLPRNNSFESYTGISLMNNRISKLPDYEVHLPLLRMLLINRNYRLQMISEEFIHGMKEVRVLDMGWCGNPHLRQSLKLLTKLRMLNLSGNTSFHEISILGELKDLEILILNETGIKEISQEIGQLVNLRRLEVKDCDHLSHLAPGVISKLWRLEELCIHFRWTCEGVHDCIVEIMSLSKLTYLDLAVQRFDIIPESFEIKKLKGFVIQIGESSRLFDSTSSSARYLVIATDYLRIPFLKWINESVEVSHGITLQSIENLNNIMPTLYHKGVNKLEYISLRWCPNVSCLVDSSSCYWDQGKTEEKFLMELKHLTLFDLCNLKVLWNCPEHYISLSNIVKLEIGLCKMLLRLFSVNVAQGLFNLKELKIECCHGLEEVIWGESAANVIVFPCLVTIIIKDLCSLKSFYSGNSTIRYPSLVTVSVMFCISMKIWGPGIHETPKLKFVDDVPILDGPSALNDAVAKSFEAQNMRQRKKMIKKRRW